MELALSAGQIVQIAGAMFILAAFAMAQMGRMTPKMVRYQVLNLIGSVVLTVLAFVERQWGFFLLEAVWAIVSVWALAGLTGRKLQ